jgi:hypothetical protein
MPYQQEIYQLFLPIFAIEKNQSMFENIRQRISQIPSIGGLIGALLGALFSARYHRPGDRPLKNAGKTAAFSGAGYLIGQWLENIFKKK